MIRLNKIQNISVVNIIIFIIIINILPVFISSTIIPGFNRTRSYLLLTIVVFLIQNLLILFYFYNKIKINKDVIIYSLLFSLIQIITIILYLIKNNTSNIMDILNVFVKFFSFFTIIGIFSKYKISKIQYSNFLKFLLFLGMIAIIFNFVRYYNEMLNIFYVNSAYEVKFNSFFINRNTYAQLLIFSFTSSFILYNQFKTKRYLLYTFIILLNLIFTFSRSALLVVIIFIISYYILSLKRKIINIIPLFAIPIIIIILLSFSQINEFIINIMIRPQSGTTSRVFLWRIGIDILAKNSIIFGVGNYKGIELMQSYGFSQREFHNFYIETLVTGGILELIVYIIIFIEIIKKVVKLKKADIIFYKWYVSLIVSIVFYLFFESASFLTIGYVGFLFTSIFILIPLTYYNYNKLNKLI